MPSGEEIQRALRGFVARWGGYAGTERSEAQTFLNQLFDCYGSDRQQLGARFEFSTSAGVMDLLWPEILLVEMKGPGLELRTAQAQVERYWRASSDRAAGRRAARFILICNFRSFQLWEYGAFPDAPVAEFALEELPDRYDALAFLAGPAIEPSFVEHYRELTKVAAKLVADVYTSLVDRSAAPVPVLQRFVLQSVWCMFAEDLGMLDGYPFEATLREIRGHPDRSAAELGHLFRVLNQKGRHNRVGRLAGTQYVNGELFAEPAEVGLVGDEVEAMLQAAEFDWRRVNPTIFGSLLEGVLGRERRWEIGAHYTHEVDIMKIVGPTIVRPWRERMDAAATPVEARQVLDELCAFRVLDPACGCGNFLYVAYRELRSLEHELKQRIRQLGAETGLPVPADPPPYYPLHNLQGIDIENRAVQIAKVTLWMGHRQMMELYGEAEPALPLQDLSSIRQADALRTPWPETDCIIGNPPFLGDRRIRAALGDEYVAWLKQRFGAGVVDLSAYWFRVAADHLKSGQRAGLVSTNTLRENKHRRASLDYLVARGGRITDAVSSQKWPGEAKVHVSITNWVMEPDSAPSQLFLDGAPVAAISTQLRSSDSSDVKSLRPNRELSFIGCQPTGGGFILDDEEAHALIDENPFLSPVVRRYLTGDDLANSPDQSPSRWIIDFGTMTLEEASRYPQALALVRTRVRPARESRPELHRTWWLFWRPRPEMREALRGRRRYLSSTLTGKRLLLSWSEASWCPSNATGVFAFDDDYSMGILVSRAHGAWAWAQSSTLKGDLRYTSSSVFMTFAWPDPVTDEQRGRVAGASRRLLARRSEICLVEQIGLTKLYNAVDEGAWADLRMLHKDLDEAVMDCYGWPRSVAQNGPELVRRLTELNREISEGRRQYAPFG